MFVRGHKQFDKIQIICKSWCLFAHFGQKIKENGKYIRQVGKYKIPKPWGIGTGPNLLGYSNSAKETDSKHKDLHFTTFSLLK